MPFRFDNKPLFGATISMLSSKVDLDNRRKDVEDKRKYVKRMTDEENARRQARDSRDRGRHLYDLGKANELYASRLEAKDISDAKKLKAKQVYDQGIVADNRAYGLELRGEDRLYNEGQEKIKSAKRLAAQLAKERRESAKYNRRLGESNAAKSKEEQKSLTAVKTAVLNSKNINITKQIDSRREIMEPNVGYKEIVNKKYADSDKTTQGRVIDSMKNLPVELSEMVNDIENPTMKKVEKVISDYRKNKTYKSGKIGMIEKAKNKNVTNNFLATYRTMDDNRKRKAQEMKSSATKGTGKFEKDTVPDKEGTNVARKQKVDDIDQAILDATSEAEVKGLVAAKNKFLAKIKKYNTDKAESRRNKNRQSETQSALAASLEAGLSPTQTMISFEKHKKELEKVGITTHKKLRAKLLKDSIVANKVKKAFKKK